MANVRPLLRFRPTDEHLFAHYLVGKATGARLPPGLIEECDIYSQEPWEIFNATSDQTFYVFTTLRKNKSRVLRTAGSGTWKEQHTMNIRDGRGELVGYKKSFKFNGGRGSSVVIGRWIMYEFSMREEMQCKYVLCAIKYYADEKKSEEKAIVISGDEVVQFEDEIQRANAIYNSAPALPSSAADQAPPAASQAFSSGVACTKPPQMSTGAAATFHLDTDYPSFSGFSRDANADSLPPVATATMQRSSDGWMKGWMTSELDPIVHSGYTSKSRSFAPVEGDYHTNLLVRASSPPILTTTMTMTPGPDICDATSPAFGSNAVFNSRLTILEAEAATMQRVIRYASYPPAFGCNRDANVLPTIATSAQIDAGDTTYPACDSSAYVDLLPTTAEQVDDNEWMDRLTEMEIDPVVYADYLSCSNLLANPSEGDTDAMLEPALSGPCNQTGDPSTLHQQRSVAESEEQDAPVTLAWADKFLLV